MKYLLLVVVAVVASSQPWPVHSDLDIVQHLERRGGRNRSSRLRVHQSNSGLGSDDIGIPDSPPRADSVKVYAKAIGPGSASTRRQKNDHEVYNVNRSYLKKSEPVIKETHDSVWADAESRTSGRPPPNAASQSHLLHPMRVQASGRNAYAEVNVPQGGYGQLKKEVDGKVVSDRRIPGGTVGSDWHSGTKPNEVKITGSASRGGHGFVNANNSPRGTIHRVNTFDMDEA